MSHIKIDNASVIFTIYNSKTRLARNKLLNSIVGANIDSVDNNIHVKALNNITLEIREGDRIALIGHNGAGKSTLLKFIAGVYEPIIGTIDIEGKVSSLIELTLGMDMDRTGYENIILRLIFMGLTFAEAKDKVDDIADYSGLSEFLNMPLRTYSSGMLVRLAYSVVTSVIPDILVMDEMIGAGDASFIHRTKQRSLDLIDQTKITILSSHDMSILPQFCNRGVWMKQGSIIMDGAVGDVIKEYNEYSKIKLG